MIDLMINGRSRLSAGVQGGDPDDRGLTQASEATPRRRLRLLPMMPRDVDEEHRASTPLELLFDLCFVVAVAQAGRQLDAALVAGHYHTAIFGYLAVFFGIWWAWVNFTWFASAYDVDDLAYRLLTFVQIVGVLILAAGVASAFDPGDFAIMTLGYVVMRVAMVAQWLRAAAGDPAGRPVALRYAVGIAVLQVGWVARLFLPHQAGIIAFYVLAVCEMLVPAWADRAGHGAGMPWHPGHISERYGLFTLIVLGECIAAATVAIHDASSGHGGLPASLVGVAAGAVLLVCSIWWWYFEHPSEEGLRLSRSNAFFWGYGHYLVFGSVAALGAGLQVAAGTTHSGSGVASATTAGLAVAVPVAVYLAITAVLQARIDGPAPGRLGLVGAGVVVVLVLGGVAGALGIGAAISAMGLAFVAVVVVDQMLRPGRGAKSTHVHSSDAR
jgi:low temperature requirement protein LtrA